MKTCAKKTLAFIKTTEPKMNCTCSWRPVKMERSRSSSPSSKPSGLLKNVSVKRSFQKWRIIWHNHWAFSHRPKCWIMSAAETLCDVGSRLCSNGTNASKNIAPPLKTWQKNIGWCYWTIVHLKLSGCANNRCSNLHFCASFCTLVVH